jgi:O-antigen/teichoic acid export membrane protein
MSSNRNDSLHGQRIDSDLFVVAKGGAIIVIGTLIENVVRLPLGIVLARFLGAEHLGLYHLAVSTLLVLASFALIGFGIGFVRFVPVYRARCDSEGLSGFIRIGIGIPLVVSICAGACLYAGATVVAGKVFQAEALLSVIKTVALILPVWVLVSIGESLLRGNQKMYHYTLANKICTPFVRCLLVVCLAVTGALTLSTAIYAFGIALVFTLVLITLLLGKQLSNDLQGTIPRYDWGEIFSFSLPVYAANLLLLLGPNVKLLILGVLGTTADVGVFSPVAEIASLAALLFIAISRSAAPRIASLHAQGAAGQLAAFYQISSRWVFTASLPLFLVLLLYPEPLLLIFGRDFVGGREALQIMAVAGLLTVTMGMTQLHITMTGKPMVKFFNTGVLYLVMFGLDWLLIPKYGLSGAAVSTLAAAFLVGLLSFLQIFFLHRMQPFNRHYFKPVAAAVLTGSIGYMSRFLISPDSLLLTLGTVSLFLLGYAFLLVALGLTDEDREFVATCFAVFRCRMR